MTRKATCCCGNCTIEVEGEPAINALCHCGNCKRRTGSAFGWSVYFRDGQVLRQDGQFIVYAIADGTPQQRWFCNNCGSTLYWKTDFMPDHMGIAGGCFAEDSLPEPELTVSNEGRCSWLGLPASWRTAL